MISDLPDDLITRILACLSLKEAARTSLLSKKWRKRWLSIPKLVFDESFSSLSKSDLFKIIHRLLLFHPHKITSFSLRLSGSESSVDVDHLMFFLSKYHDVQEFTLDIYGTEGRHVISPTLFSFENLRYLYLSRCVFCLPYVFERFSHLKQIEFCSVDLQYLNFSRIMAGCPLLESVAVFDCFHLDSLVVGGPKLKHFNFSGHTWTLSFTMSPVLSTLELDLDFDIPEMKEGDGDFQWGDTVDPFACLPSLNRLSISICILPFFGRGQIPASLPTKLESLKTLTLKHVNCESLKEVSIVLCLMRSSPNLQVLEIQLSSGVSRHEGEAVEDFIEAQNFSDTFSNLRELRLEYFDVLKNTMMFLQLVLSKSPYLEHLYVYHRVVDASSENGILVSLTKFVRDSSSGATYMFNDYY